MSSFDQELNWLFYFYIPTNHFYDKGIVSMKIRHLLHTLLCVSTCASISAGAAINADRGTIRVQANGTDFPFYDTRNNAVSDDGRFVVESISGGSASTLGTISLTDMQLRKTTYLKNNQGGLIFQSQVFVAMSPSGRYIALRPSSMTNADFGPEKQSLYLYDTVAGTMNPVEKSFNGAALQNCTTASSIIGNSLHNWGKDTFANDKQLFFYSSCSNLVSGDTNGAADIFVYNIETQTIELVTRNPATGQSFAGQSVNPRVSKDGNIVAFASTAPGIAGTACASPFNEVNRYHVYVLNRKTNAYTRLNEGVCHAGSTNITQLAYDVSDDAKKVHFLGKTHSNGGALVSYDVTTAGLTTIPLEYSVSSPVETNKDGSVILFRSQGYYDDSGVYHATDANGNSPNAYGLYNVNTATHTLVTTNKTTGALWSGFPHWQATLSPSGHVVTFGQSGTAIQQLVNTTMTSGEASVYYYIQQPFAKNSKWITMRGTFNNWTSYGGGMTLVGNNSWEGEITFAQPGSFKFDAAGDWSVNYGDNNADGVAGSNESNINIGQAGRYKVAFNDQTKQYLIKKIVDVKFNCFNGVTTPDQSVYVVGNITELANWVTANAIKLTPTTNFTWTGNITVPANINIEWKCVKLKDGFLSSNVEWEPGANNQFNSGSTQTADGSF